MDDIDIHKLTDVTSTKVERPSSVIGSRRSRKASHYLRVFKDADDHQNLTTTAENSDAEASMSAAQHQHEDPQRQHMDPQQLPDCVLNENRTLTNPVSSDQPGSSVSRRSSLPTLAAEKSQAEASTSAVRQQPEEPSDDFVLTAQNDTEPSLASEDDSDSEREQISSALYFPHRRLGSFEQVFQEHDGKVEVESIQDESLFNARKEPRGWAEREVPRIPKEVEISLRSQDTSRESDRRVGLGSQSVYNRRHDLEYCEEVSETTTTNATRQTRGATGWAESTEISKQQQPASRKETEVQDAGITRRGPEDPNGEPSQKNVIVDSRSPPSEASSAMDACTYNIKCLGHMSANHAAGNSVLIVEFGQQVPTLSGQSSIQTMAGRGPQRDRVLQHIDFRNTVQWNEPASSDCKFKFA
jgi:hypothetical protein